MQDITKRLSEAEHLRFKGEENAMREVMLDIIENNTADIEKFLSLCSILMQNKYFNLSVKLLEEGLSRFGDTYRVADLLVDACFQIGRADSALRAYSIALERGIPLQSEAVRRVTRTAIWCGRLNELRPLLNFSATEPYQIECARMLEREQTAFSRFEDRFDRELGGNLPSAEDILQATRSFDLGYASFLYNYAARSESISEKQLIDIVYKSFPPAGPVATILAFTAWRLEARFPDSPIAKLEVGINGLLQFGDAQGARDKLEEALKNAGPLSSSATADRIVRLSTSCSVFGTMPLDRTVMLAAQYWSKLGNPEYGTLANGFASRSRTQSLTRRERSNSARYKVALCVSGQLRNYQQSWPSVKKCFESHDVTTFLSTWDSTGAGFGTGDSIARKLPDLVRDRLADAYQSRKLFETRYPGTFSVLQGSEQTDINICKEFFETDFVRVRNEKVFEKELGDHSTLRTSGNFNQAKMYFGIHDVMEMRREYELQNNTLFDVVIRIRPDLSVRSIGLRDIESVVQSGAVLSTHLRYNAVGDVFLMMNSVAANVVGGMWPAMKEVRSFKIVPGASGAAAETALFETLCWSGISVRLFKESQVAALNSVAVEIDALWHAFRKDLLNRDDLDDTDMIIFKSIANAKGMNVDALDKNIRDFLC